VPRAELDDREADLIAIVNQVMPTRNIKRALKSDAHVPFDDFISSEEQSTHLQGEWLEDNDDPWRSLPERAQKHAARFVRFQKLADANDVLLGVFVFVWSVLPRPRRLEARFWSTSLFPSPHILRVNAGQQEVFTIQRGIDGELYARVMTPQQMDAEATGPFYETGSYENFMRLDELVDWLTGDRLLACRQLAVRLMRHTTALNSASHCPQVARAADDLVRSTEKTPN
jgi:hypothetical protein